MNAVEPGSLELPELVPFKAPRVGERREWSGYLTTENAEHVAAFLREFLDGYSYVWAEYNHCLPGLGLCVDTGRVLSKYSHNPTGVSCIVENGRAHVSVSDTYGSWGLHSDLAEQPAWFSEPADEDEAQARKWATRLEIGRSASYGTFAIHITQLVPAGKLTHWTIARQAPEVPEVAA